MIAECGELELEEFSSSNAEANSDSDKDDQEGMLAEDERNNTSLMNTCCSSLSDARLEQIKGGVVRLEAGLMINYLSMRLTISDDGVLRIDDEEKIVGRKGNGIM